MQRRAIKLTLEESGWLCHFMMDNERFRSLAMGARARNRVERAVFDRQVRLYHRIARINDELMGKTDVVSS